MSTEVVNNVDVLYKPGKPPKDSSLEGNLAPKDELYNKQSKNNSEDSISIEPVNPKLAATSRAITTSRSFDEIPSVKPEKKLTKISHGRSRSSLSDIDCNFVNRPTSVDLNVAGLSDEQLKDTVLQLEHEWVFWYDDRKGLQKGMTTEDYENSIRNIGKFGTIQNFWRYYNNLQDVSKLPDGTNIRIFKAGIKPTWEDPMNCHGGKWVIATNKDSTHFMWSKVLLAIIGEQFEHSDALCGVVVSIRNKGDTINVWNKSGENSEEIETTINELKKITGLSVKYQLHTKSSSFSSPDKPGIPITRSFSNPIEEDKKRRLRPKHKKSSSVSEDTEVPPAVGHSKSSSMDLGRKFDVVTSPRDFRRSFDLPKKKMEIGQIKTEEELRHRRTPSQDKKKLPPVYPTKKPKKEEVEKKEEEVKVEAKSIASEYIYVILAFSVILTLMYLYHRVLRW